MKRFNIHFLFFIFSLALPLVFNAQDSLHKRLALRAMVYAIPLRDLPGLPISAGAGIVLNKHCIYTGPEFFKHYYARDSQRSFGWNLGYNFTPNPENKYFQLYFSAIANWYTTSYRIKVYGTLFNNSSYTNITDIRVNGFTLAGGYGFITRFKRAGFMLQLVAGAQTEDWTIKNYNEDNDQAFFVYHQKIATDFTFSFGGVAGIFVDFPFK